jgi:hypothetical protein
MFLKKIRIIGVDQNFMVLYEFIWFMCGFSLVVRFCFNQAKHNLMRGVSCIPSSLLSLQRPLGHWVERGTAEKGEEKRIGDATLR